MKDSPSGAALAAPFLVKRGIGSSIAWGALVVVLFFGVLGSWSYFARLASAAIAQGEIGFAVDQTVVEHLEGGIVLEVHVAEGDRVHAGQPLLKLEATRARSQNAQLESRLMDLEATEARLSAERDGLEFVSVVTEDTPAAKQSALASEEQLYRARQDAWLNQQQIVRQRIAQLNAEIAGLQKEIRAQDTRLELLSGEAQNLSALYQQKLVGKQRLTELELEIAEVEGLRARSEASIARANQAIAQEELEMQ